MKDGEFWVRLDAGLCNRFRVLISSIGYSEMTGRKLFICWPTTPKWERWPFRRWPACNRFEARIADLWTGPFIEKNTTEWDAMVRSQSGVESAFPPDPHSPARQLYLSTIHDFYKVLPQPVREYATRLNLHRKLKGRLCAFLERWAPAHPAFGIHIRLHEAHEKTTAESPISWFEKRIGELHVQYPSARFFLSTDSRDVSAWLHNRFPGLLTEQLIPSGYNTRQGIEKGLIDLYILSKTDYIIGSYWSSFSYMAATLQGDKGYEDSHLKWGNLPEARTV